MPARRSGCSPASPLYNLRGSAYYDKGEYDIAIADFNDALRIGPPSGIIFHNRGNAWRGKGDYAKAIADYDSVDQARARTSAFSLQNRGISKQALGDLDGALADINEAIRLDPSLPQPLTNRAVIWRAKGDLDRAIADAHRGDPARQGQGAGQHHDAARQRADLGLHPARASPTRPRAISTAPSRITPQRSRARPPTPAARPTRRPRRFACRCCRRRTAPHPRESHATVDAAAAPAPAAREHPRRRRQRRRKPRRPAGASRS